jgi:hypothetical protein
VLRIVDLHLSDQPDVFIWSRNASGQFSVRSIYNTMIDVDIMPHNRFLWKLKIPLKVKVFLWFLYRGVTLTKDNLAKINWHGNKKCCFLMV